jgi:hypothetical protein
MPSAVGATPKVLPNLYLSATRLLQLTVVNDSVLQFNRRDG